LVDLASLAPASAINAPREALYKLRPPDRNSIDAVARTSKPEADAYDIGRWQQLASKYNPTSRNSEGQALSSDILASYSTAELTNPTRGTSGLDGETPELVDGADT